MLSSQSLRCAGLTLAKWTATPRIISLLIFISAFLAYHSHSLVQFAAAEGKALTPWVFPHLLTPAMLLVYGSFTLLLFCDAPFMDNHTPFVIIRCGRMSWLDGQLLYIIMAGLIYSLFFMLASILVLAPNLTFTNDWGTILKILASNPSAGRQHNLVLTVFISEAIVQQFSPLQAMLISLGLFWLTSVFTGFLIFSINLATGKTSGLFVAGAFICMTYFSGIQGRFVFGDWISYLSPLSWASMHNIRWGGSANLVGGLTQPSAAWAVGSLVGSSVLMVVISRIIFVRQDIIIKGGQEHD
ncbi:MAG: hypothetical protein SCM11_03290 [Bacillota bacterium]|nr:hypothetical protein [Bacillota bacterium]